MINIVSAIYGDPTLGANLKFVITRMIFYEDDSLNPIVEDNSKASLENVNAWNDEVLRNLRKNERHDIAVWLTRLNIGGPSGKYTMNKIFIYCSIRYQICYRMLGSKKVLINIHII